ncbi:MAG TPA: glycosyltransferase [Chloroflexota bacterium]
MRIAIAADFASPWVGGPAAFIDNFRAYLRGAGHQVEVIAPSLTGLPSLEETSAGVVRRVPTLPVPFGYHLRVSYRPDAVRAAVKAARPDVLQVHHPFPLGLSALRAARSLSIPVVAVNHTIPECSLYGIKENRAVYPFALGLFRRYLIWFLEQATKVSTPTETAALLLRGMAFKGTVTVISNGIDTTRFSPAADKGAARSALGLPNRPILLYTGRLDAEKDMDTWLRAAARLPRSLGAHLVIGGDGTDRPRLERLAAELGLVGQITFPGYLPASDLPTLYQAADAYCITSAVELQSITTLEAVASGLPVIAARAGALPELVEDGVTGYLALPGDVEGFARGMTRVLEDPAAGKGMGMAGRARAEHHALPAVGLAHESLLASVVRGQVATLQS